MRCDDLGARAPLFMKIRDDLPGTAFAEPLYRSAICVDTNPRTQAGL
jgi:hypothetical protein